MGISPGSPVMQGLKSFWQRPEGTVGKIALVIACLAAGYGFVQLLPWLIAAATDTLHLVLLIWANQADKKLAAPGLAALDQQQFMAAKITNQRHAASLISINKSLTDLRNKLQILYDQLIRWRATAEFQVTDKENRVSEEEMRRKALKKAYSVFQAAKKIFRGDPVANEIYDQTLEYLANDAGQMLGEMEDFNRLANKLMTNMDLETGAINDEAVKQLTEFQQKLVPSAGTGTVQAGTGAPDVTAAGHKDDYSDLIR